MKWIFAGALLAGLGVTAGALGAHGLEGYFTEKYRGEQSKTIAGHSVPASWKYLQDYRTAVRYQMYHALGLIAVGLLTLRRPSRALHLAGALFVAGIVLFSGSLYVLTIAGEHWMGVAWGLAAATGGTAMILGWLALAVGVCPCRDVSD